MEKFMKNKLDLIMISPDLSIRKTMQRITDAGAEGLPSGIAVVVDDDKKLLGVVTDGDIRRALVKDIGIDSPVEKIMVREPITVPKGLSEFEIVKIVTERVRTSGRIRDVKVDQVIVIDNDGRLYDIVNFFELWKSADLKNKTICVVGLGFVGLTLAVVLSDVGFKVIGYDLKEDLIKSVNNGHPPFYEKGLSSLIKFHINKNNFRAVTNINESTADIYILSVGTPVGLDNNPDLQYIKEAAHQVGQILKKRDVVILRSTVPVGTTRNIVLPILEKESSLKGGEEFYLSFAPERTVEGKALEELRGLPQIVGGYNQISLDITANFFSHLNHTIVRVSSLEAAEMVKLINNSFRDISFGFANEFTLICDKLGLNAVDIINAANEGYPRNPIPVPSPGVGGVCLKKDPYIYISSAGHFGIEADMPRVARKVNEYMPQFVFNKIGSFIKSHKRDEIKIFIIGFAFKGEPETSDMRNSPTVDILNLILANKNFNVYGYDPIVLKGEIEKLGIIGCSLREGFKNADCVLIMNNHRSYRDMDILGLIELMNKPALLFDGWQIFPQEEIERVEGIIYGALSG